MKKLWIMAAAAALLAAGHPGGADTRNGTLDLTGNPSDGLFGYHLFGTDQSPRGISFDGNSTANPIWGLGLAIGGANDGDLILSNYLAGVHMLQMRGDAGELWVGPGVGHPGTGVQLSVTAGTSTAPRIGMATGVYGDYPGLQLYQWGGLGARTSINFANTFRLMTDSSGAGAGDIYLWDAGLNRPVWQVMPVSDLMQMNYGATINGTATVNGPAALLGSTTTLGSAGSLVGFYGGTPQAKPVITGCRSDGTALEQLLQKMQAMGLLTDQTTP